MKRNLAYEWEEKNNGGKHHNKKVHIPNEYEICHVTQAEIMSVLWKHIPDYHEAKLKYELEFAELQPNERKEKLKEFLKNAQSLRTRRVIDAVCNSMTTE